MPVLCRIRPRTDFSAAVTAAQKTISRTAAIQVKIVQPDHTVKNLTYAQAKAYVFQSPGKYRITYTVTNRYNSSIRSSVTVTFKVKARPTEPTNPTEENGTAETNGTAGTTGTASTTGTAGTEAGSGHTGSARTSAGSAVGTK